MNKDKKTEVITVRLSKGLKEYLDATAVANQWSVAQVVSNLIEEKAMNPFPNTIIISIEKLEKLLEQIKSKDKNKKAIQLEINLYPKENKEEMYEKGLEISTLRDGFKDHNNIFEYIAEMTYDEMLEIEEIETATRERIRQHLLYEEIWNEIMLKYDKKCENCQKYPTCALANKIKEKACNEWIISYQEWEKYCDSRPK